MRREVLWIVVLLLAVACAGCGTLYPRTVVSPPMSVGADREEHITGGSDTSVTERIVIEVPAAPGEEVTP
jgi:predicted small lipoprotein YifL